MIIEKVTITGADDSVDPNALIQLSQAFPFVEWGILLSKRQQGCKRFPSDAWLQRFEVLCDNPRLSERVKTSGHICGQWTRDLLQGVLPGYLLSFNLFDRMQLNTHGVKHEYCLEGYPLLLRRLHDTARPVIIQIDGVNDEQLLSTAFKHGFIPQALFDLSHGAGVCPTEWPRPISEVNCGYAGGLGPDNIIDQLKKIEEVAGDAVIWIDMETKVRSNNDTQFDLQKVSRVLTQVHGWKMNREAAA